MSGAARSLNESFVSLLCAIVSGPLIHSRLVCQVKSGVIL